MTDEVLPIRYCHGCGQYDDHPRVQHISVAADAATDKLYHYDCVPFEVAHEHELTNDHPAVAACAAGKRGQEVRDAVAASDLIPKEN